MPSGAGATDLGPATDDGSGSPGAVVASDSRAVADSDEASPGRPAARVASHQGPGGAAAPGGSLVPPNRWLIVVEIVETFRDTSTYESEIMAPGLGLIRCLQRIRVLPGPLPTRWTVTLRQDEGGRLRRSHQPASGPYGLCLDDYASKIIIPGWPSGPAALRLRLRAEARDETDHSIRYRDVSHRPVASAQPLRLRVTARIASLPGSIDVGVLRRHLRVNGPSLGECLEALDPIQRDPPYRGSVVWSPPDTPGPWVMAICGATIPPPVRACIRAWLDGFRMATRSTEAAEMSIALERAPASSVVVVDGR